MQFGAICYMSNLNVYNNGLEPDPYYSDSHATFGDRLCAARDLAGLSQKVLASKMGVRVRTIQAWESDSVEPRANKLQMVSALLNVSMVWLMSGLGNGIAPPQEKAIATQKESLEILNELRSIRSNGEALLTQLTILEEKISKGFKIL